MWANAGLKIATCISLLLNMDLITVTMAFLSSMVLSLSRNRGINTLRILFGSPKFDLSDPYSTAYCTSFTKFSLVMSTPYSGIGIGPMCFKSSSTNVVLTAKTASTLIFFSAMRRDCSKSSFPFFAEVVKSKNQFASRTPQRGVMRRSCFGGLIVSRSCPSRS